MPEDVYGVNMPSSVKRPYHHGNLRAALVEAGHELADAGGPDAVTVREAARRVGVSAPAAYRHFADRHDFLVAVAQRCREDLARAMIAASDRHRDPFKRFEATGVAYVDFAVARPGAIATAFAAPGGPDDPDPYVVLVTSLDDLAACGMLPADRREGAEIVAWSMVHGLACAAERRASPGQPGRRRDDRARHARLP